MHKLALQGKGAEYQCNVGSAEKNKPNIESLEVSFFRRILCVPDETKREREFYRARGLPCPKDILPNAGEVEEDKVNTDTHAESDYHRADEQV